MPAKKLLIKELLRVIELTNLEELKRKEMIIRLMDGSEVVIRMVIKAKLKIVKND